MIVSVTLARGAMRMAAKHVIVKRLAAIETSAAMDVLCTDKTGTLTEAKIALEAHSDIGGPRQRSRARAGLRQQRVARRASGARSTRPSSRRGKVDLQGWTKIDEVPFDFERRRVSVLAEDGSASVADR